jgi:hypothetical protein
MGQPITVVEKPSSNPAVLRFETNRPLTGMGHERYTEPPSELRVKTGDELARRLFAAGGIETVHINGSVVTVTLSGGRTGAGLGDIVRSLFLHYGDQSAEPAAPSADDADKAPETLADTSDAPAAQEADPPAAAEPAVADPPAEVPASDG